MWLDEDAEGYVYEFIHKETKKWYVGSRRGKFDPTYHGSGVLWEAAKRKHGIESFDLVIHYEGFGFREQEEILLKSRDAQNDLMSYNLKNEAFGGSFKGPLNGMFGKTHTEEQRYKCGNAFRGKKRPEHSTSISGENNGRFKNGKSSKKYFEEKALLRDSLGVKHILENTICPHCCLRGAGPNMTRYHFDNCKLNEQNPSNEISSYSPIPREDKRKKEFICPHCGKVGMNEGNMNRWHFNNCKVKE